MFFKPLFHLLLASTLALISSSVTAEDIIENGSFEEHGALDRDQGTWGLFNSIPNWFSGSEPFEIQRGDGSGIGAYEGTDKLELDADNNSTATTVLTTEIDQSYIVKFKYSPRVEKDKFTNTNNVSVWWDDNRLKTLSGRKRGWIDNSFIVKALSENSQLKFKGQGSSDSFGGLIDDVEVFNTACFTDNKIQNGSFEEHGVLDRNGGTWGLFNNIPHWQATKGSIEIQEGDSVGVGPFDGLVKAELDSDRNSTIKQTLNDLEEGKRYQLILSYSPRVINNKDTNKIRITWNGKRVAVLTDTKRGWVTKTFTVTAGAENNVLKLAAIGKSDALGGLIDNVQLYKLDCELDTNAPVALDQNIALEEDTSQEIVLTATDNNIEDVLSYSVLTQPENGTLTGETPNLIYTPETNFNGEDSFTFIANNGTDDSNIATVTIVVSPVNDAPTAGNQLLDTNKDTALPIVLSGDDIDEDIILYTIVQEPLNGDLTGGAPNLVYTPNTNFIGEDSFTFLTNDGQADSDIASVTINVTRLPDTTAPVITINGGDVIVIKGSIYNDEGATAFDEIDGVVDVVIIGVVDISTLGIYTIIYSATDSAGNVATKTRQVTVKEIDDTTPPTLTLNGGNIILNVGEEYTEQGAQAFDNRDGDIDVEISGEVITSQIGIYIITYTAIDSAGNSASIDRRVTIQNIITEECKFPVDEHYDDTYDQPTQGREQTFSNTNSYADIDNDGDLDFVAFGQSRDPTLVRSNSGYYDNIFWMKNDGTGKFSDKLIIHDAYRENTSTNFFGKTQIFTADIDGDGDTDFYETSHWYENNGSGEFTRAIVSGLDSYIPIAFMDIDESDASEVIATNSSASRIYIFKALNVGNYTLQATFDIKLNDFIGINDFDNDGVLDVVGRTKKYSLNENGLNPEQFTGIAPLVAGIDIQLEEYIYPPRGQASYPDNIYKVHDFNGDGYKDVLLTISKKIVNRVTDENYTLSTLVLFENDGNNNFTRKNIASKKLNLGDSHYQTILDFDNDGLVDIVAVSTSFDEGQSGIRGKSVLEIILYKNTGDTFIPQTIYSYTLKRGDLTSPSNIDYADLDDDEDLDILISYNNSSLKWYENCTETSFDTFPPVISLIKNTQNHLHDPLGNIHLEIGQNYIEGGATAFDLRDGDVPVEITGNVDIDIAGTYIISYSSIDAAGNIIIKERKVTVSPFSYNPHLISEDGGSAVLDVFVVDLNNDGIKDIITAAGYSGIVWYENGSDGTFVKNVITSNNIIYEVSAADLDNDDDNDIVAYTSRGLFWYRNDGNNVFAEFQLSNRFRSSNRLDESMAIVDINGDGNLDIVGRHGYWFENDGAGVFTERLINSLASSAKVLNVDFDGDGDEDVISFGVDVHFPEAFTAIIFFENNGLGEFTRNDLVLPTFTSFTGLEFADLDNDNDIDIVATDISIGDSNIVWFENDGLGNFFEQQITSPYTQLGNGQRDVVNNFLCSSCTGVVGGYIQAEDIDGDGDIDLLVSESSYGEDYLAWLENDGNANFTEHPVSTISNVSTFGPRIPQSSILIEDFDLDGYLDFITVGDNIVWHEQTNNYIEPIDTIPPIIDLVYGLRENIQIGQYFTNPLVRAYDNRDGDVPVEINGSVDTNTLGEYTLTITASDSSGNSTEIEYSINVRDSIGPQITLLGCDPGTTSTYSCINIIEYGSEYIDAGAIAEDNYDGIIDANIFKISYRPTPRSFSEVVSTINTELAGTYEIRYQATDSSGNRGEAPRGVIVTAAPDTIPPVITIIGGDQNLELGSTYQEKGATAVDNTDGNVDVTVSGAVNSNIIGVYVLTYSATDSAGNSSEATRIVTVSNNPISILSPSPGATVDYNLITIEVDDSITDVSVKNLSIPQLSEAVGIKSGDSYFIYNIMLQEGVNNIEIKANEGSLSKAFNVTSLNRGIPPVEIELDQYKAIDSLITQAKINHNSLVVTDYLIDTDGDKVIDIFSNTDSPQLSYLSEGSYTTNVTVRTDTNILYSSNSQNNLTVNILENPEIQSTVIDTINGKVYDLEENSNSVYALTTSVLYNISKIDNSIVETINLPSLTTPEGFTFDADHNLFIADTGADRIIKLLASNGYQEDTTFELNIGGSGDGELLSPMDVTTSGKGPNLQLYVLDSGNNRIQLFDYQGKYLAQFDGSTTLQGKLSNPINMIGGSNLIVTDAGNNLLRELSYNSQTKTEKSGVITNVNDMGKVSLTEQGVFIPDNSSNMLFNMNTLGESLLDLPMSNDISVALLYEQSHQLIYQEVGSNQLKHVFIPKTPPAYSPLVLSQKFVAAYLSNDDTTLSEFTSVRLLRQLNQPEPDARAREAFLTMSDYKENIFMYGLKAVVVATSQNALGEDVTISFDYVWQNGQWLLVMVW